MPVREQAYCRQELLDARLMWVLLWSKSRNDLQNRIGQSGLFWILLQFFCQTSSSLRIACCQCLEQFFH